MIAFSNKKFLTLFVAMVVACSLVAVADAERLRLRGVNRERHLKMDSKGKSKGMGKMGSKGNNGLLTGRGSNLMKSQISYNRSCGTTWI